MAALLSIPGRRSAAATFRTGHPLEKDPQSTSTTHAPDFERIFRASSSPCLIVDRELIITDANEAYLKATQTSRQLLVGQYVFDAFPDNPAHQHPDSTANLAASFERVLRRREQDVMAIQRYDIRVGESRRFEERYWSPINTPVFGADGEISHIIHRVEDVTRFVQDQSRLAAFERLSDEQTTEIHLANARLRESNIELEREREMRELFVLTLTHDLRTPLAAAKFGAQLLFQKGSDPFEAQRLSARIASSLDRCDAMISDLLDANHLRSGQKLKIEVEPLELIELVTDTLAELATLYGDRFVLQAGEPIHGRWSRLELRRMLENLCINGIKYGVDDRAVRVNIEQHGELVDLQVHNWGTPIPEQEQAKLFEPYHRRSEHQSGARRGWGLGLTVVGGIAAAHGGSVSVQSSAEQGTTFRVTLPVHGEE